MFATVQDVRTRWRGFPAGLEDGTVEALLSDAAVWLRATFPAIPENPPPQLADVLRVVSAAMVKRALLADGSEGLSQQQATAGSFSYSQSYSNPNGALFITGQERAMLESALDDAGANGARSMEACGW